MRVQEPNAALRWIECHPSFAGYIVAVGTVAAFCLALFGPPLERWLRSKSETSALRTRTAQVLAAISPLIVSLIGDCGARRKILEAGRPKTETDRQQLLDQVLVVLPGALDVFDPIRIGLDPETFLPATLAAAYVRAFNGKLHLFRKEEYSVERKWGAARELLLLELDDIRNNLDEQLANIISVTSKHIRRRAN